MIEGNPGETDLTFTVTLSAAQTTPVTVQYTTAEDTAQVDLNYVGASGTLTFAAGETSKTVTIKVKGDTLAEGNERFFLRLLNPTGATLADAEGVGTILDDGDTALTITLDDVSQNEGDNNTPQQFVFTAVEQGQRSDRNGEFRDRRHHGQFGDGERGGLRRADRHADLCARCDGAAVHRDRAG